ncbi:GPALPP motifs-containing protein 1 [Drosophila subobscura]|uniref:GPALPP motifs-containing protein 1 n=1 Tax=Drosophila subobscura TaxID=7241 RepID=UPI00155A75F2|nr:GPALPP motifs-containing protein 1 [Drosophila subobscura]XP_034664942.1 GPALPP motifs-containing protein 1 [Drosophila subobscura]
MSSDECSSDSSSASEERKRKHKKSSKKSKKHKKEKKRRHKEKKRSRREEELPQALPALKPIISASLPPAAEPEGAFGAPLPPHLRQEVQTEPPQMIGPVLPSALLQAAEESAGEEDDADDDMSGTFGPLPNATQVELEERALALKLSVLQGGGLGPATNDKDGREEWMLELPDVGLKGGLAALNNLKRTFHQGKERPDFSDRSEWTKTPQSVAAAAMAGPKPCSSQELEQMAQERYVQQRDDEQERMAKKHKKKHKRDESLVAIHQKKLRKEQKEKEKELAAAGLKAERRPFSRDVDLKLNKIDSNQTKQIVDKAKILNSKFSRGQSKYL